MCCHHTINHYCVSHCTQQAALEAARAEVMAGLGAASMESHQRAYPFLLSLHCLRELEQGHRVLHTTAANATSSSVEARTEALVQGCDWSGRLASLAPGLRQRAPVLTVSSRVHAMHKLRQ
jgi:hypothetical protein